MEKAHHAGQAPATRLLLVRLPLVLLGGVLLVLLFSRPADAAERRRSGLLDPVGGTLAAATEPVGSLARGAAGDGRARLAGPAGPPPGGQDTAWDSPATGLGMAVMAGTLFLFGLRRQGRALAERSGTRSRPSLPLVSPA